MLNYNRLTRALPLCFIVFIVMTASTGAAQGLPHGKWWHLPKIAEQLNLTIDEIAQLDEAYLNSRRNLIDLKRELEKGRLELDALLESDPFDEPVALRQFKTLEKQRARLSEERFRFLLQVRSIIGSKRFLQLKIFYEIHKKARPKRTGN